MANKKYWFKRGREEKHDDKKCKCRHYNSGCGVYGLGFIGAAIYFLSNATGFWSGVLGILKALVWPVFLVLELFKYLAI